MVISRSSIPQQIMKPGVKKMKQGRKTRRNTTPATKDIKKSWPGYYNLFKVVAVLSISSGSNSLLKSIA